MGMDIRGYTIYYSMSADILDVSLYLFQNESATSFALESSITHAQLLKKKLFQ